MSPVATSPAPTKTAPAPQPPAASMGLARAKDPMSGLPVVEPGLHPGLAYLLTIVVASVAAGLLYLGFAAAFMSS